MVLIDEASVIDGLFRAVVEAVEEAIVNSLFGAETMSGAMITSPRAAGG